MHSHFRTVQVQIDVRNSYIEKIIFLEVCLKNSTPSRLLNIREKLIKWYNGCRINFQFQKNMMKSIVYWVWTLKLRIQDFQKLRQIVFGSRDPNMNISNGNSKSIICWITILSLYYVRPYIDYSCLYVQWTHNDSFKH